MLKRFVDGAEGEPFYQKRAPEKRPEWLRTVTLSFPSGRTAEEVVVDDAAGLAWIVNLGCIELHPHRCARAISIIPTSCASISIPGPGVAWDDVRRVALEVKALLEELGLRGWPKTSGSRGMHVNVRIEPRWTFTEVRRAALAFSREIERRAPTLATSKWWKEERHGVFLDYNQNAKDRTTCSAYSVRPLPDARVSAPLDWDEVPDCEPADFTVLTMPARFAAIGDPHAGDGRRRRARSTRCSSSRRATRRPGSAMRRGRRTFARWRARRRASRRRARRGGGEEAAAREDAAHRRRQLADKEAALAGLERWKARHPEAAAHLAVDDVLVDSMRGRSSTWTRIRVNLRHVPEDDAAAAGDARSGRRSDAGVAAQAREARKQR